MTDKELHKLRRPELLELLFVMREEIDKLHEENEILRQRADIAESNKELLEKIFYAVCPDEANRSTKNE